MGHTKIIHILIVTLLSFATKIQVKALSTSAGITGI
jgi:hypothetical protein